MAAQTPTVQFYEGIPETISDVRLRQNKSTGDRSALLVFEKMEAIEQFKSFRNEFSKALKMIDEEGVITIEPSGVKFIFGGPEGDDLVRVECIIDIDREDHWERFMRFMYRYADANGMAYGENPSRGKTG
jgi:photosystem II Psb28-2 protein